MCCYFCLFLRPLESHQLKPKLFRDVFVQSHASHLPSSSQKCSDDRRTRPTLRPGTCSEIKKETPLSLRRENIVQLAAVVKLWHHQAMAPPGCCRYRCCSGLRGFHTPQFWVTATVHVILQVCRRHYDCSLKLYRVITRSSSHCIGNTGPFLVWWGRLYQERGSTCCLPPRLARSGLTAPKLCMRSHCSETFHRSSFPR